MGCLAWLRVERQRVRLPWRPAEVEVVREVAQDRGVLADVGAGLGPAVGARVKAPRRRPPRKSSSMNLLKASNDSVWWSM